MTLAQTRADLGAISRRLEEEFPDSNRGWGVTIVPLMEQTVGNVRPALLIVLAGVGVILLMAAVNVANLLLARSVSRQRELAVRTALGASPARLVRQSLTESVMLAFAGAALSLLFVRWGVQALVALAPIDIPRMQEVAPDSRALVLTLIVAIASGLLVGLLPALATRRQDSAPALQDHSRGAMGASRRRSRLRGALVVAEVAMSVVLTIGAGLLLRSFTRLMMVDPGFRSESVLTLQMNLPDRLVNDTSRAVTADERRVFYDGLLDRLAAIPGVTAVGGTTRIPLGSSSVTTSLEVAGSPATERLPEVEFRRIIRDYFTAMGTPVVRGRLFTEADGPTAASVAVVNQTLARRMFPDAESDRTAGPPGPVAKRPLDDHRRRGRRRPPGRPRRRATAGDLSQLRGQSSQLALHRDSHGWRPIGSCGVRSP